MSERPGPGDRTDPQRRVRRSSPWPVLVALGLVVGEVGILFGVVVVGFGGLLLFGWSCAALVDEAGLTRSRWTALLATGGILFVVGGGVWIALLPEYTVAAVRTSVAVDPLALRAAMVCGAALTLVLVGIVDRERTT